MKVDLCDIRRLLRADFFAKDRDVTLQSGRSYYSGGGELAGLPDGAIVLMFSGAVVDIPTGWQLADGTNGTTDLRGMFVVGAGGAYNPGDTGGADTVDISHTHGDGSYAADNDTHGHDVAGTSGGGSDHTHGAGSYATDSDEHNHGISAWAGELEVTGANSIDYDTHSHDVTGTSAIETSHTHPSGTYAAANDTHSHTVSGTSASGGDTTHDNRPSFYALCFIMRPS